MYSVNWLCCASYAADVLPLSQPKALEIVNRSQRTPPIQQLDLDVPLRLKTPQKPYIVWSLGPKALTYESLEPKGSLDAEQASI